MTSIADSEVLIQTSSVSVPSPPSWFGEVVLIAAHLRQYGVLIKISERVRFARRRFGHYEVIDFLAVLFGYAISGERTLEAFYERLQPFAVPFMALFGRDQLPARSTLSRFLAALTAEPVDALRMLFLEDLESRPLSQDKRTGGLVDRAGNGWVVFDVDGTREAARQRALPQTEALPPAFRRLDEVCAPGYTGRKRGQVVRTRTVVSQAHTYQWLGTFGNRGNGSYRVELRQGLAAIGRNLYDCPEVPVGAEGIPCIAAPLNRRFPMRIRKSTPIAGAATPLGGRSAGRWCRNGCGTCAWSWGINCILIRSAPPSLLRRWPQPTSSSLPPAGMASPLLLPPSRLAGSPGRTSPSSPMARCTVLPIRPCRFTNDARKLMAACAWCMEPASAGVVPVRCESLVNGMAQ